MFEVQCLDSYGNTIDYFTQWDVDQKIIIPISEYEDCLSGKINQHVHFCNSKSEEALVVRATIIDKNTISAEVPNILLQEPYPLIVYVYLTDSEDVSSQRTVLHNEIPIRKRVRPDDYNYVENIERITAEMIKEEIEADTEKTRSEAITAITTTKNDAVALVGQIKESAVNSITATKDAAEASVTKTKEEANASITATKTAAETSIINTKNEAEASITKTKTEAIDTVTQTKTDAVTEITNTKNEAGAFITEQKEDFVATGNQIIADTQAIHDATAQIKTDTQAIADTTADTITDEIEQMMYVNGMVLYSTDDGNGNVTTTVVIPQE